MVNHIRNLEEYVENDIIYNNYIENKDNVLSDFDKFCISHIEDIKYVLSELKSLYELIDEMKNETIKTQQKKNERKN